MRSIVIDQVRARQAVKRGGGERMATNAALEVLERLAPDFHRLVERRYFAGLSVEAVA